MTKGTEKPVLPPMGFAALGPEGRDPALDHPTAFRWNEQLQRLTFLVNWFEGAINKIVLVLDRVERLERVIAADFPQRPPEAGKHDDGGGITSPAGTPGEAGRPGEPQALTPKELKAQKTAMRKVKSEHTRRLAEAQKVIESWGPDGPTPEQLEEYQDRWMRAR